MKKTIVLLTCLGVLACGEKKSDTSKTQEVITVDTQPKAYTSAPREAEFKDSTITRVYDNYNTLKTALVNTDAAEAKKQAAQLQTSLNDIEGAESLKAATASLIAKDDIEEQREDFQNITARVKVLVENSIQEGTLFYQYCPMAFEGKGAYWISNEKTIRNPYWGDKMLTCGVVDQEIK